MFNRTVHPRPELIGRELSNLFTAHRTKKKLTVPDLARAAGRSAPTVSKRLTNAEGWEVDEVFSIASALDIPLDALASILFPGREAIAAEVVRLEREVWALQDENAQLREGRFEAQSVVRDILRTGRWAVSVIPNMAGPTPQTQILTGIRVSVAPLDPALRNESAAELRRMLTEAVPSVIHRALWLSGNDLVRPGTPGLRGGTDGSHTVLDLSVPVFEQNRAPAPPAERTRMLHRGRGVLVVSTTTGAWGTDVAALVGRSVGWGVNNTRAVARMTRPPLGSRDGEVDRMWLRTEADHQLRNLLLDGERSRETVYSHWGWSPVGSEGSEHPLVGAINAAGSDAAFPELPFVVLLREEDALLEYYGQLRNADVLEVDSSKEARLRANRDALWQAVMLLPADQRLVVNVRSVSAETADERSRKGWMRSVELAHGILRTLLGSDVTHRIKDPEAALLMSAVTGAGEVA
jgi:transcriptional regulator with XRE-family HTH domain